MRDVLSMRPDEHVLAPIVREGLQMMTGLFWDLADNGVPH
jgi:hypothetical protein